MSLKVLVVDDTITFRKIVSDCLAALPEVEVVATAANGQVALALLDSLKPDLMILDLEMPQMNGLEVLKAIRSRGLEVGVIILSSLTAKGGDLAIKALEHGAFEVITKPGAGSIEESRLAIRRSLATMLAAFKRHREIRSILKGKGSGTRAEVSPMAKGFNQITSVVRPELIVIGISTGGPDALAQMLPMLSPDLNIPMLIVQHMPPLFTRSLAKSLAAKCAFEVKEAEDNESLGLNKAYLAPGGKQMKLVSGLEAGQKIIRLTDDPAENNCRPSVDYLFRSVAYNFPGRAVAVIMTGMGSDGTLGLKLLKRGGCLTMAQSEDSCVVFGMPREAIAAGVIDLVVPLGQIASEISKAAGYRR